MTGVLLTFYTGTCLSLKSSITGKISLSTVHGMMRFQTDPQEIDKMRQGLDVACPPV